MTGFVRQECLVLAKLFYLVKILSITTAEEWGRDKVVEGRTDSLIKTTNSRKFIPEWTCANKSVQERTRSREELEVPGKINKILLEYRITINLDCLLRVLFLQGWHATVMLMFSAFRNKSMIFQVEILFESIWPASFCPPWKYIKINKCDII